ncbi:MAG: enoyl-CoA hydratase/isomerase family protein, partial [Haliea sp.]
MSTAEAAWLSLWRKPAGCARIRRMNETILYERTGHIGRLVLNNPSQHNALGQEQLAAIQSHLATVQSDDQVRVLIITGWGDKTFCAGASLQQLGSGNLSGDTFQET